MEEEAKGWLVGCSLSSTFPQPKYGRQKSIRPKYDLPKTCRSPCYGRGGAFLSPVFLLLLLLPAGLAQHHHLAPEQGAYTAEHCWRGGSKCDFVTVRLLSSPFTYLNSTHPIHMFPNSSHEVAQILPDRPQFVFQGLAQTFHISLHPDTIFIPPRLDELTTESSRESMGGSPIINPLPGSACFYSGKVRRQSEDSSVAVCLCRGMRGHLRVGARTYYIEPVAGWQTFKHYSQRGRHRLTLLSSPPAVPSLSTKRLRRGRPRRSTGRSKVWPPASRENWVEVLVVVDGPMVRYHGKGVRHYVLTLMHIVSLIYRDSSLGNLVHISVAKLLILKENETFAPKNRAVSVSASDMLKSFCKWQTHLNQYGEEGPVHYDVALLLTRVNICRRPARPGESCDTLGLAELGTMCNPHSCAIVQDNGLSAAFTIAHELGHV